MLKRLTIFVLLSLLSLNVYAKDKELDTFLSDLGEKGKNSESYQRMKNPPKFYDSTKNK